MGNNIRPDAPYEEFAKRLHALRIAAGLSRTELAKKCGIVGRTLINYENGTRVPDADVAVKMAAVFGLSVPELLGMEDLTVEQVKTAEIDALRDTYIVSGTVQAEHIIEDTKVLLSDDRLTREQKEDFVIRMQKTFITVIEAARGREIPAPTEGDGPDPMA